MITMQILYSVSFTRKQKIILWKKYLDAFGIPHINSILTRIKGLIHKTVKQMEKVYCSFSFQLYHLVHLLTAVFT